MHIEQPDIPQWTSSRRYRLLNTVGNGINLCETVNRRIATTPLTFDGLLPRGLLEKFSQCSSKIRTRPFGGHYLDHDDLVKYWPLES